MNKEIYSNIKSSLISILPITIIVTILSIFISFTQLELIAFYISTILLSIGVGLFTFGADTSMMEIGTSLGQRLIKSKNIILIVLVTFIIGLILTIAEPDLTVFATQLTSIPSFVVILTTGLGVGIFFALASIRTLYNLNTNKIFIICYILILILLIYIPSSFIPLAFDAGGVTTGSISVPFVMALGLGLTTNRSDTNSKDTSFGMVGLCSIGPVLTMLILGLFFGIESNYTLDNTVLGNNIFIQFINKFLSSLSSTLISIIPIIIVFIILILFNKKKDKYMIRRTIVGIILTIIGLTLFLTGVETGFLSIGYKLGEELISKGYDYLFIILGIITGFFSVYAEPAIRVLTNQIEKVTEGSLPKNIVLLLLAIGASLAVGISYIRSITGLSIINILLPGYIIAIILTFITPELFTSIAFDAGGAAVGPLSASFMLPIAIGATLAKGGNVLEDAFGLIALLSFIPLITIQILGIYYQMKLKHNKNIDKEDNEIIEYTWEV